MKTKKDKKYNAIICQLTDVRPHKNADRLKVAYALGYQVIVSLDAKDGDIGVVFPEGGALSHEMLFNNDLYRKNPETGEKMGGYFESSGRIKTVKLRGENSEAFFTDLESLSWVIEDYSKLKIGLEFNEIGGKLICKKHYTKATLRAMKRAKFKYKKPKWLPKFLIPLHKKYTVNKAIFDPCPDFKKHFETPKLRQNLHNLPDGVVYVTDKCHGTSGRTGLVKYDDRSLIQKLFRVPAKYQYITGTRNVVKNPKTFGRTPDDGYYAGSDFRFDCHKKIISGGLKKDQVIYYEILGWVNSTTTIMPDHPLKWSDFKSAGFSKEEFEELNEQYSGKFTYHYGNEVGKCSIKVYRITQNGIDLSWDDMVKECDRLGLETVELLYKIENDYTPKDIMEICKEWSEKHDPSQLREGVVLRFEDQGKLQKMMKYKSTRFCVAENIKSNDETYVNLEEIN